MKKVLKKFNRTLSIMLAVAMVLTMVPQTAMPVLAAENDAAIEATADVGETSEGLSDEQNEEVTEPSEEVSDEGNSEEEGDDITNEDPSDEDPVEEEPSEGDVEDNETETPVDEADVEDGNSDETENDLMSAQPNAVGADAVVAPEAGNFDYATTDTDVTDGFTFTVTAKEGHKITAVKYQVNTDEATDADEGSADNTYIIPASVFADAAEGAQIKILVTTEELEKYAITYTANEGIEKLEYTEGTETKVYDNTTKPQVTEGQDFKFTLTAKKYYKITEVKADDTKLTADTKGVYTIENVTKATTITVVTALDEKQCNSVTFKLDTKSDAGSATAKFSISENDIAGLNNTSVAVSTAIAVPSDDVSLVISPKSGYEITKIDGKTVTPAEDGTVTQKVAFKSKKATVTVTTEAKDSVSNNTIIFDNKAPHMTYKVTGDAKVTAVKDQSDTYLAAEGGKRLKFTVTVTGSYLPTVTQKSSVTTEKEIEASKTTTTKTGATYEYVIPTSQLTTDADDTFTITEAPDYRTFTLSGDLSDVDIKASKDGKRIGPDEDGTQVYTTLRNDTLAFQITAKDGATLKSVTSQVGENGKATAAKITNGVANVEIKATDDVTIKIDTEAQYNASKLQDKDRNDLPIANAKNNSYNVSYNGTYKANVTKGISKTPVTLSEIKVLLSGKEVKGKEGQAFISGQNGTEATIDLSNADADVQGKTLTLELYTKEGDGDDAKSVKVASYTMVVTVAAKDLKINAKAEAAATQAVDTTKTYNVTAAKGVDLSTLAATAKDDNNILAAFKYENGKLTVTTAAEKPVAGQTAIITIAEEGAAADAPKATLTITAADLISSSTKAPTVKLVAATDISFKLALSAKTEQTVNGNLYYKVNVDTLSGNDITATKTTYVQKQNDSQNSVVYVSANKELGTGAAGSYSVTASLVHATISGNDLNTIDADKQLGESQTSKKQTFKTQTPAYEDKLKLKKINATVVTGQKDVVIAEPQFNKYTTFASLTDAEDISWGDDAALDVELVEDDLGNYQIKASATEDTAIGKHKIQVTSAAETGAYASVATIDITVVRGVHTLDVKVPSLNLYKAAKKAATAKATVVYNSEISSNPTPKNKTVTWSIVGADKSDNAPITKVVTVKNGTVTVDKNYILDSEAENNQFRIKVTAANTAKAFVGKDEQGKDIVGYSPVITITSTGEDIKTIAIVQKNSAESKEYIKALPGSTDVHASDIAGGRVVVLNSSVSGLQADVEYTSTMEAAEIELGNLTLKSSNQKSVAVSADGTIQVNKVGKVKLTATANDGSKNKAELSLNIINDESEGTLGLAINKAELTAGTWRVGDELYSAAQTETTKTNAISSDVQAISVSVMEKAATEGAAYEDAPKYANYSLKVSGGTIVQQNGNKAVIAIKEKDKSVKITLTDASKKPKVVTEYVLTRTGADTLTAPGLKASKLHKWATVEEQIATVDVTKLPSGFPSENVVAKVAVDWTAMNAKNQADLTDLAGILKDEYAVVTTEDNKVNFTLKFSGEDDEWVVLNQKSYKLKVTLYQKNAEATTEDPDPSDTTTNATYTALTLPTSMTVSVDSAKKFTFKPTTSYTLTTKDAKASAFLTGKANVADGDSAVDWLELKNMNTKGVTNNFTEYFEIAKDADEKPIIKLKDGKTVPDKAHCTGYITYNAYSTKSYYSDSDITNTVKITVKLDEKKTVKKYAQKKGEVGQIEKAKGSTATVSIMATEGKNPAALAALSYVMIDPKDTKNKDFAADLVSDSDKNVKLTWNGANDLKVGSTITVKLLVVPTSSYYKETIDAAGTEDKSGLIKDYGISTSVKVKVVDAPTVNTGFTVTVSGADTAAAGSNDTTYIAAVTENGEEVNGATVTWSVTGGTGTTAIGENTGVLTVDAGQAENSELTITATYTPSGEGATPVTGTKTVTVTAAE